MKLSDVVEVLGIPQSSASNLAQTLVDEGVLHFDSETRCFVPSIRVALLGAWVMGGTGVARDLLDILNDIYCTTGQSIMLAIQKGMTIQNVTSTEPTEEARLILHPETNRPLHKAASGIALLSRKTDEEIGRIMRHWNSTNPPANLIAEPRIVMEMIEQIRERGFIRTRSLFTPGYSAIAVLFPEDGFREPMALSLGGLTKDFSGREDEFVNVLRTSISIFHSKQSGNRTNEVQNRRFNDRSF